MTSTPPTDPDYLSATAFTIEELRAGLRGASAKISPALAASLVGSRDYPERIDDLRAVLLDDKVPLQVRMIAAASIGRLRNSEGNAVLRAALREWGPPSLKSAIEKALGELRIAKIGARIESQPEAYNTPSPARAQLLPIKMRPVESADLGELAARRLAEALPTIVLEPKPRLAFECGRRKLLLFLARSLADQHALSRFRANPAIVAVIAARYEYAATGFAPRFLIEIGPERGEKELVLRVLHGRRHDVLGEGAATIEDEALRFQFQTLVRPAVPMIAVEGSWTHGDVVIDYAASSMVQPPGVPPRPRPH